MAELTDEARVKAGKSQMFQYLNNQYIGWHVMAVESIRKIVLEADRFYADILAKEKLQDVCSEENVHKELRTGWFYEAVSHAEQAIEDLFSLLKKAQNVDYFARDVVIYNATEIKRYIWDFKTDDLAYILKQFHLPYFDIENDTAWENKECFQVYRTAVLLIQDHVKKLVRFHRHYYQDYCQYKHGMAVSLRKASASKNPLEGALWTYDSNSIEKKMAQTGEPPALIMELFPETQPYVRSLHDEKNLLHASIHSVNLDEILDITKKAVVLLNTLRINLMSISERVDDAEFDEYAFPYEGEQLLTVLNIGFPRDT